MNASLGRLIQLYLASAWHRLSAPSLVYVPGRLQAPWIQCTVPRCKHDASSGCLVGKPLTIHIFGTDSSRRVSWHQQQWKHPTLYSIDRSKFDIGYICIDNPVEGTSWNRPAYFLFCFIDFIIPPSDNHPQTSPSKFHHGNKISFWSQVHFHAP